MKEPSFAFTRYLTASVASPYLVAIPSRPVNHIQNTAPGPPIPIAVATPTILPVPIVAARAVARAAKPPISPDASLSGVTDSFTPVKVFL